MRFQPLSRILSPGLSLASGLGTLLLFRQGVGFAPVSLAIAVAAWVSAVLFARYFGNMVSPDATKERSTERRFLGWLSRSVVVGLYQNVLFFVSPIWFGSAELLSANIAFPILLAALTLFSCFDEHFHKWILDHRAPRAVASALMLFSVSVPAVSLANAIHLGLCVGLSAGCAAFAAVVFGFAKRHPLKAVAVGLAAAAVIGAAFFFVSPFLPPVPVQCVSKVAAAGIEQRLPVGVSEVFPAGVARIHAHFSVAAPQRFTQNIRFQWFVNGRRRSGPIPSSIVGGRKLGFRTWTYLSAPRSGDYRVDLETDGGQLIGRVRFRVK